MMRDNENKHGILFSTVSLSYDTKHTRKTHKILCLQVDYITRLWNLNSHRYSVVWNTILEVGKTSGKP